MKTTFQRTMLRERNALMVLCLALSLITNLNIQAQTFAVLNASSSPGANGIYHENGTYYGKPKYTNGSYTLFKTPDQYMEWAIVPNGTDLNQNDVANSLYSYSTKIEAETPPCRAWHHGGNTTGLPGEMIIVVAINAIGYSHHYFTESTVDDGTIKDTALVYLHAGGITFTGDNGADFMSEGKATATGLPDGLGCELKRLSDTTLQMILIGAAANHTMLDNTTFQISFQDGAVSNGDVSQLAYNEFEFGLLFQAPYFIEGEGLSVAGRYMMGGMYNEYPWFFRDNYYLCTKSCLPKWIIRSESNVHPLYSTQIETEWPHNRQWHQGGFFYTMGDPVIVGMENSLVYENYSLVESRSDDGTYKDSIVIRYYHPLAGSGFSGVVSDDFIADGKVLVSNVPEGLEMVVRKYNDTTLYAHLTGTAAAHDVSNNIQDLKLEFQPQAFTGDGIFATNSLGSDTLNVVNMMEYVLVDTSNFPREVNGVYTAFDIINGNTAYIKDNKYYIIYRNTPPNCVWGILANGSQNAYFSSGVEQDTPPAEGWVKGDWSGTIPAPIALFPLQPWLGYYDLSFEESTELQGSIADTMMIILHNGDGILFSGSPSDDFISLGKAEIFNLPEGLTAGLIKVNDTLLYLIPGGTALNHSSADDIANLTIQFPDEAFTGGTAAEVMFSTIYSGEIEFNNFSGMASRMQDHPFSCWPNPADDHIYLKFEHMEDSEASYALFDTLGKVIMSDAFAGPAAELDVSGIPEGVYLLRVVNTGRSYTEKIRIK